MTIWIFSKYTTIPGFDYLPSRWFYLSKNLVKNHKIKCAIFIGDNNHLSTVKTYPNKEIEKDGVIFKIVKSLSYSKTGSPRRVISWFYWEIQLLKSWIKEHNKPDVVICSSLSILSIVNGLILKIFFRTKLVFEIRDIWPLTLTEEGNFSKYHPLVLFLGFIEKLGIWYSDLIVGTMPGLESHIKTRVTSYPKVITSPIGVDDLSFDLKNKREFQGTNVSSKTLHIGYFGSVATTNALEPFINAIELSFNQDLPLKFTIIGSGDSLENYKKRLKKIKTVEIKSKINHSSIFQEMAKCDILFLSTHQSNIWKYGQSMNKIVDYMLASKPIIAMYSGLPSMINESKCGEFIPHCTDKELLSKFMEYHNKSKKELQTIGENGLKWLKSNHSYSKLAKEYFEELNQL